MGTTQRGEEDDVGLDNQSCSLGASRSMEKPFEPRYLSAVRLLEGPRLVPPTSPWSQGDLSMVPPRTQTSYRCPHRCGRPPSDPPKSTWLAPCMPQGPQATELPHHS